LVVSNMFFPFHIWVVIRKPLTNSMIFQRGRYTTNQSVFLFFWYLWQCTGGETKDRMCFLFKLNIVETWHINNHMFNHMFNHY
jgi:hypothetical protein